MGVRNLLTLLAGAQQGQEHDESQSGSPPLQDGAGASGQDGDGNAGELNSSNLFLCQVFVF